MSTNYAQRANALRTLTVAAGQTVSEAIDLGDATLVGIHIPATFDGTQIKLQTSPTLAGTYTQLHNNGDYTLTVAASKYLYLDPSITAGVRFLRIECVTSQSTTSTVFNLALKAI